VETKNITPLASLPDGRKMELAILNRMHLSFSEAHPGLKWLDATEQQRQAAKTAAENELDTPGKRLAFFAACTERQA
jgi:hypothetical protein